MMVMMMETKRVTAAVVVVELRRIAQVFCRADASTSCSVHVPKDMDDNAAPLTLPFVTSFYGELAQDSVKLVVAVHASCKLKLQKACREVPLLHSSLCLQDVQVSSNGLVAISPDSSTFEPRRDYWGSLVMPRNLEAGFLNLFS